MATGYSDGLFPFILPIELEIGMVNLIAMLLLVPWLPKMHGRIPETRAAVEREREREKERESNQRLSPAEPDATTQHPFSGWGRMTLSLMGSVKNANILNKRKSTISKLIKQTKPMKTNKFFATCVCFVICPLFCCSQIQDAPIYHSNGDPLWKLSWSDDFDTLNRNKWRVKNEFDEFGLHAVAIDSNVYIRDGLLILRMREQLYSCHRTNWNEYNCNRQGSDTTYIYKFTSSHVESSYYYPVHYGYLEARIAYPSAKKFNSATFWTFGQNQWWPNTTWSELDIAELGCDLDPYMLHTNIHTKDTAEGFAYYDSIKPPPIFYPYHFLIFSAKWDSDTIAYYVNGFIQSKWPNPGIHDTVQIHLNIHMCNMNDTIVPGYLDSMTVDWVRVWTWSEPCPQTIKEPWLLNPLADDNNPGKQTMTVMWQLDCSFPENTTCTLRYDTTPACSFTPVYLTGSTPDRLFKHTLDNLMPGTRYYYSVEIPGNPVQTFTGSFYTAPSDTTSSTSFFAYGSGFSDQINVNLHDTVCHTISDIVSSDPSQQTLLVHTGSWNSYDSEENWSSEFFNPDDTYSQWIRSNMPIMGVFGENEKKIQTINQTGSSVVYKSDYEGLLFQKYFPYNYYPVSGNFKQFHSFDYGPVHFCMPQFVNNEYYIDSQLANDLISSSKEWKVFCFHQPVFSLNGQPANSTITNGIKQLAIDQGVQLVIMGQEKYYAHWIEDDIHYMILGNGGSGTEGIDAALWPGNDALYVSSAPHFARFRVEGDMMFVDVIQGADWNGTQAGRIIEQFAIAKTTNIQSNTVWQQNALYPVIVSNINIEENVTMVVKSEVNVAKAGNIIVQKGAKLTLNTPSSKISGIRGYTEMLDLINRDAQGNIINCYTQQIPKAQTTWDGIFLLGTEGQYQNDSCKGVFEMQNGAVIENAFRGVATFAPGTYIGYVPGTGGIIHAEGAIFRNCVTGIKMYPFKNTINGKPSGDKSYFYGCTFVTDDDYLYKGIFTPTHMDLDGIYQLRIQGCTFRNDQTIYPGYLYHGFLGTGILAHDASMMITPLCTTLTVPCGGQLRNSFTNLYTAIHITQPLTTQGYSTLIKEADFTGNYRAVYANSPYVLQVKQCSLVNNYKGIYLLNSQGARVESNQLEIAQIYDPGTHLFPYGLYIDAGNGFSVEGNGFTNNFSPNSAFGVLVNNTGAKNNEIYRNTFQNILIGIQPQFRNKGKINNEDLGLCLFCNNFDNSFKDIRVAGKSYTGPICYEDIGINPAQQISISSNYFPAGNLFSPGHLLLDTATDDHDFSNYDAEHLTYSYDPNSTNGRMIPYVYSNIDPFPRQSGPNQCVSKSGNIKDISQCYDDLASAQLSFNSSRLIRDIWKNGGIEDLQQQVELVLPWEAYQQYNELMSISPYVAADALIAMIENPSFTDLMVKLVCVANPQAARNDAVLGALYDRTPPMPEQYIEEILDESGTYSPLDELEGNAAADYHLVRTIGDEILRMYFTDTVNLWAVDSITQFLSRLPGLEDRYTYALHCLRNGDLDEMQTTLDDIPLQFELSERESLEYEYLTGVFAILESIKENDLQPGDLTGEQTDSLILMLEVDGTVDKALAIAILLWNNPEFEYNEPILEPPGYQMRKAKTQKPIATDIIMLKLYPNPARDYFTVYYGVPESLRNSLSLQVKDATGRIVLQQPLPANAFEYLLDTGILTKGIYTVVLVNNKNILKTEKLVIIK